MSTQTSLSNLTRRSRCRDGWQWKRLASSIQNLIATHDLLFFLPYTSKVLAEKGRSYDVAVNEKLPEILAGYFRPITPK